MIGQGKSIYIEFDDCGGDGLSDEDQNSMIAQMREIANKYGYDFHSCGDETSMKKWFASLITVEFERAFRETLDKNK